MIKENIVKGSVETTLHDFNVTTSNMQITINGTKYTNKKVDLFTNIDNLPAVIDVITPTVNTDYEIWFTDGGIEVLNKDVNTEYGDFIGNPIDRLCWFTVPTDCVSLDNVEINLVVMKDEGN